ncbi:hypothetical protein [Streptomyces sp. NPDC048411]|uniref:hypothetical protein n=1 Tax=Streptomyces sp. NPDC048411 TaxID=3157206 RepID=UPI003454D13A
MPSRTRSQRWQLPASVLAGHITGIGGKCADLNGSGSINAAATALRLNTCGTGVSQDWSIAADGSVQIPRQLRRRREQRHRRRHRGDAPGVQREQPEQRAGRHTCMWPDSHYPTHA